MNILVVSYYFPPFEGVASRRWAKYSKYLNRLNHNVNILCNEFNGTSPWDEDIKSFEDKVTRVKTSSIKKKRFEKSLPVGFLDKVLWKLSYLWDRVFGKKRNLDPSHNCIPAFYEAAIEIIEKNEIEIVIVSGGPYEYLDLIPALKKNTSCKLVLDLRDPWPYEHNSDKMTKEEQKDQKDLEERVIHSIDAVVSVYETIIGNYKNKKGAVISHALDFEDFQFSQKKIENQDIIKLVFGGHPYSDSQYFEQLNVFMASLKKINKAEANCYIPESLVSKIDFESNNLSFYPYKKTVKEFLREQNSADAVLYIVREEHEQDGNFTTKFLELIMTRKPILYFGPKTKVSDFIKSNELGFVVEKDNISETINAFLSNMESNKIPKYFDLTVHSFEKEVLKLEEILIDIHAA